MQSHKIIEESTTYHIGSELKTSNIQLYSSGSDWYIAAPKVKLKKHYPLFYDSVYRDREDNEPTHSIIEGSEEGLLFMPISHGTATVLQRVDGYADVQALLQESADSGRPAVNKLPGGGTRHAILATVESKAKNGEHAYFIQSSVPEKPETAIRVLGTLDKYSIDIIGTLAYNVTLPVTAPFRFFANFFSSN